MTFLGGLGLLVASLVINSIPLLALGNLVLFVSLFLLLALAHQTYGTFGSLLVFGSMFVPLIGLIAMGKVVAKAAKILKSHGFSARIFAKPSKQPTEQEVVALGSVAL